MCELFGLSASRATDLAISLSLFRKRGGESADYHDGELNLTLVATEPLTQSESWEAFAPGELRAYREGQLITQIRTQPKPKAHEIARVRMREAPYANVD